MKKFFIAVFLVSFLGVIGHAHWTLAIAEIADGSFENFDDTWECDLNCTQPANSYFVFSAANAVDGIYYAYIFHDAGIYQNLTIPANATTLAFAYDNQPDDEAGEEGSFTVSLADIATEEVYAETLFDTQSDEWIVGSLDIPESARGQEVQLYISNTSGYNRIDALEFTTTDDADEDEKNDEPEEDDNKESSSSYASLKLHVLSAKNKPVKKAKVFVTVGGVPVSLLNLKTNAEVMEMYSNKKGRTPKFQILQPIEDGVKMKLCVQKKKVKECTPITPEGDKLTSYDFTFSSRKVKFLTAMQK